MDTNLKESVGLWCPPKTHGYGWSWAWAPDVGLCKLTSPSMIFIHQCTPQCTCISPNACVLWNHVAGRKGGVIRLLHYCILHMQGCHSKHIHPYQPSQERRQPKQNLEVGEEHDDEGAGAAQFALAMAAPVARPSLCWCLLLMVLHHARSMQFHSNCLCFPATFSSRCAVVCACLKRCFADIRVLARVWFSCLFFSL